MFLRSTRTIRDAFITLTFLKLELKFIKVSITLSDGSYSLFGRYISSYGTDVGESRNARQFVLPSASYLACPSPSINR